MTEPGTRGRENQKRRTYNAILAAAVELTRTDRVVTMPEVAERALVSEATAYRYFPDIATLLQKAMATQQTDPREALAHVADSSDVVERVAAACDYLLRHVLTFQKAIRATIATTIVAPDDAPTTRRGLRFELIDFALAPLGESQAIDAARLARLREGLAVVIGAESLFCLLDQCGMPAEEAITSIVSTATTLTRALVDRSEP
ncbi:TetR/AcrR family transcriptional regulator [Amycolatopsis oliviviridis]|uniref:TetR/AcrR family transcriptional regulator n=1 Tax=Amycolatopsis oliviviridis TaxID=1471590 RepID=UPI001E30547F|nr:TetR/AcrR family transcriptional regulator [Amycolatopsis oliviviridis]